MVRLARDMHGQPAHKSKIDVIADFQAKLADVEVERFVLVEHVDLGLSDGTKHVVSLGLPRRGNCLMSSTS